jgi:outer membrane biosynthesis protein TonB
MTEPEEQTGPDSAPVEERGTDTAALAAIEEVTAFQITRMTPDERAFVATLLLSLGLHSLGLLGTLIGAAILPEVEISFEESTGISLMRHFGYVAQSEAEGSTQLANIAPEVTLAAAEEAPAVEEADAGSDVEEEPDVVEEDVSPEEDIGEEPDATLEELAPEPSDEAVEPAQPQPEADAATPVPTPEEIAREEARQERLRQQRERRAQQRAERLERERQEREAAAAAEAAAAEGSVAAGPDMNLPPSERYPAGTLNPVATDVSVWGPDSSVVTVILRNDRIRTNQHRGTIENMLSGLPDWRQLAGGARLNPFDETDAMLIATSDPRWLNRTFMAAVHRVDPREILSRLSAGYPGGITWEEARGRLMGTPTSPQICPTQREPERLCDPRIFLVPSNDLFIFTRPEFLDSLQEGAPRARGLEESLAWVDDPNSWERPTEGSDGSGAAAPEPGSLVDRSRRMALDDNIANREEDSWITGLRQIADYGGTEPNGPHVVLTLSRFSALRLPGMDNVTPPNQIHASGYLESDPRLHARFMFSSQADAEAWVRAWPDIVNASRVALALAGVYQALSGAAWTVDHNEAIGEIVLPRASFERLGIYLAAFNEQRHGDD